jgi:flagellar biosynthesis/type III secretory pathway protein FliH
MDTVIRSADLNGMRRSLRSSAPVAAVAAPAQAIDWHAECERLRSAMDALRQECDARLAARDAQLEQERAALSTEMARREARVLADATERGHTKGFDRGLQEGKEVLREQAARLADAAAKVSGAQAALLDEAEDGMVELVFEATCRMLGNQDALRAAVMAAVAEARRRIGRELTLTVVLHPDDLEAVRAVAGELANVSWAASDEPGAGGCVIESTRGALDARLDTQLDALRNTLLAVRGARRNGKDAT